MGDGKGGLNVIELNAAAMVLDSLNYHDAAKALRDKANEMFNEVVGLPGMPSPRHTAVVAAATIEPPTWISADKIVLVIGDRGPFQRSLSKVKKGDRFLHFPHLRTSANITAEELRKHWAVATSDAEAHALGDGHWEWCVDVRRLTDDEELRLPESCGGPAEVSASGKPLPADKTVLVTVDGSPTERRLSQVKRGDRFLESPLRRHESPVPWCTAGGDAQVYDSDGEHPFWGVPMRPRDP